MGYIMLILLILNTTIAYATFFKRKFEENLILTIVSYIIILFLTGALGSLNVGFYLIIGANIILLIYNIYALIKKKVSVKEQIFTLGFILFIATYLFMVWANLGRMFSEWDEFSHWGLVVKNMFSLGNFGLGEESTVLFKTYLSGTSIFQFFCTKLSGEFKESMLYIGMNIMTISTIIPMFKDIKTKKSLIAYICYAVLLMVPIYFCDYVYKTLLVDSILALAFGYTLYSYFSNYEEGLSKFKIISLMTNLAFLVLIKDFGLVLAGGSLLIILIDNLFVRNKFHIKDIWKNSKYILMTAIPMIAIKLIWMIVLKTNNVTETWAVSEILPTILNFFKGDLLPYQQTTVNNYTVALFERPLTIVYSFTFVMCVCLAIILAYIVVKNSNNKKAIGIMLTLSVIGALAYAFLLMFVPFLTLFSEYEAVILASYVRYMNSYILGLILMELALIIKNISSNKEKLERFTLIFFAIFIITFPFVYIEQMTVGARTSIASTWEKRSQHEIFDKTIDEKVNVNEKVYFIATNTTGEAFYIARYLATPVKLNPATSWSIGTVRYSDGDIWTIIKDKETWKQELIEGYDYVYLYSIDETFIENYGKLFYNSVETINNNQLYKVNKTENTESILELVEE